MFVPLGWVANESIEMIPPAPPSRRKLKSGLRDATISPYVAVERADTAVR
jgi:hypothetical protein